MFKKAIDFIKYNNAALLIFVAIFLIATGALATETGRDALGSRDTRIEGVDNTLLLEADIDKMDMDFTISSMQEDENYYYVTYTYIDLVQKNGVWQYQMLEKGLKVTKKLKADIGEYIAEELGEVHDMRILELKEEQARAMEDGESKRVEISEFNGLLGATLDVAGRVFPDYEPITRIELPSPVLPPSLAYIQDGATAGNPDSLTDVYNNYIESNDPDGDNVFGDDDNCPYDANPKQRDYDDDGLGDECDPDFGQPDESDTATGTDETVTGADETTSTGTDESMVDETATGTDETAVNDNTTGDNTDTGTDSTGTGEDSGTTKENTGKETQEKPAPEPEPGPESTPDESDVEIINPFE